MHDAPPPPLDRQGIGRFRRRSALRHHTQRRAPWAVTTKIKIVPRVRGTGFTTAAPGLDRLRRLPRRAPRWSRPPPPPTQRPAGRERPADRSPPPAQAVADGPAVRLLRGGPAPARWPGSRAVARLPRGGPAPAWRSSSCPGGPAPAQGSGPGPGPGWGRAGGGGRPGAPARPAAVAAGGGPARLLRLWTPLGVLMKSVLMKWIVVWCTPPDEVDCGLVHTDHPRGCRHGRCG